jgi:hypothetical protein
MDEERCHGSRAIAVVANRRLIVIGLLALLTSLACANFGPLPPTPSLAPAVATARSNRNCSTVASVFHDIQHSANPAETAARTNIGYRDGWVEVQVTLFRHAGDYQEDWTALRRLYEVRFGGIGSSYGDVWVEMSRLCALADDLRVANISRVPRIPPKY